MKGYKAFNQGWKCKDFQYEIGKTYELEEGQKLEICKCGFHFCANPIDVFGYYRMNNNTVMAEVEALGEIQNEGTKFVTDKIRIVREFTREQLQALILDNQHNSGNHNSGRYNSGNYNSGKYNSGDCNSGNYNTGGCNCGSCNSGDFNSGHFNSGNHNSGDYNDGDYNDGDYNSGSYNSGDYNIGNYNSGHYNSGNYNSGFFNTDEPKLRIFNESCEMTRTEFLRSIDYSFYSLCDRIRTNTLLPEDNDRIKKLPNFNAKIFKEITGIEIN